HKIESMVIHLEDRQNVVFNQRNVTGVVNREQRTMLTDFFDLNVRDPNANQFLYKDIVTIPSALDLWLEFRDQMSEDYQNEPLADTKYMKALGHIRSILVTFGCTLADYNLPEPDERGDDWWHRQMPNYQDDMTA
ncbi:hypothetical protein BpHYR1_017260, partial [Brachionus plicatilis]